jgi:hypothetical protein
VLAQSFTNEPMRNHRLLLPLLLLVATPCVVDAQLPTITPERRAALAEANRLSSVPAEFVLKHRTALALTGAQVASLETLASALRDSTAARMARQMREAGKFASAPGLANAAAWTGPVDEAAIRDVMRQQSEMTAALMIAIARDRRAVAALLTPAQQAQLLQLQTEEMLKAARGGR